MPEHKSNRPDGCVGTWEVDQPNGVIRCSRCPAIYPYSYDLALAALRENMYGAMLATATIQGRLQRNKEGGKSS